MVTENNIYLFGVVFTIWFILFLLGIHYIFKFKLWNPVNYLMIMIIIITYSIILFQIVIITVGCIETKENFDLPNNPDASIPNQNTNFKLYDRKGIKNQMTSGGTQYNWKDVVNYGSGRSPDTYNGFTSSVCDTSKIVQLTDLVSTRKQQLLDAQNAYNNVIAVENNLNNTFSTNSIYNIDANIIQTLMGQLESANSKFLNVKGLM